MKHLNLPILDKVGTRILFVGAGGGFDIFAALPIYSGLAANLHPAITRQRREYAFANLTATKDQFTVRNSELPQDYPEGALSNKNVFSIGRNGAQLIKKSLLEIRETFEFDTIITVDGGIDSLMKGNEVNPGTYLEDFLVLSAVNDIDCKWKIHACVGFGSEIEEDINHYRALENIAALTRYGYFLGSCSLTPDLKEFKDYKEVCEKTWENNRKSHIHTKIIPAIEGEFGDFHMYEDVDARLAGYGASKPYFLSPLSGIYWFFDTEGIVSENPNIAKLKDTNTFTDAMILNRQITATQARTKDVIPL